MAKINNTPSLRADMEAFLKGSEGAEGGRAAMALDLVEYLFTPIVYTFEEKDGTQGKDDFLVRDIVLNKPKNGDGSESKVLQGHRRVALLVNLFGFPSYAIPQRMQSAIDKLIPEAIALAHYCTDREAANGLAVRMDKVPGDISKTSRRVIGGIPAVNMFALLDDKGALTSLGQKSLRRFPAIFRAHNKRDARDDLELQEFMCNFQVEADGRASSLFDGAKALTSAQWLEGLVGKARVDGVLPPASPRNTKGKADKGSSFKDAVALVLSDLEGLLTSDEANTAMTPELETMLDHVAERWAAFRVRFPRETLEF